MIPLLEKEPFLDKMLKVAVENSFNHIVITDANGIILYANKAAQKITGYTFAEMKGNTPRLWGQQMSEDFYANLWNTIKKEKKVFKGEIVNRHKKGEQYISIATISPQLDIMGNVVGFIGFEEDITEMKNQQSELWKKDERISNVINDMRAQKKTLEDGRLALLNILEDERELEDELKKEKESIEKRIVERTKELAAEKARLLAAISSLPHAFLIVDDACNLVLYNSRLTPTLGKPNGTWTFQKVDNSLGAEFDLQEYAQQVIKGKKEMREKEILVGKKYLKVFGAPILPESLVDADTALGSIITISDVTEARMLARSRDEFFSIASHELRTPLTAIRGNTSMILDYYSKDLINPDLKIMITDTHDASVRLIGIVNDFLDMSRLELKKMEYKNEEVNLSEIGKKIIAELAVNAGKKGVVILNSIEESMRVWADKGKVEQILLNLVGNSLKFTEKGSVIMRAANKGKMTEIEVEDTGRGIPIGNQSLLFHKFQQAGSSTITRDAVQGTGLGLYISRLMAEGMGGTLELVKSIEGKGSVFCLTLPIQSVTT